MLPILPSPWSSWPDVKVISSHPMTIRFEKSLVECVVVSDSKSPYYGTILDCVDGNDPKLQRKKFELPSTKLVGLWTRCFFDGVPRILPVQQLRYFNSSAEAATFANKIAKLKALK